MNENYHRCRDCGDEFECIDHRHNDDGCPTFNGSCSDCQ